MARNHRTWQQPKFKTIHDSTVHTGQFPHVGERTQDYYYLCLDSECWHSRNATLKEYKAKRHERRTEHTMKRITWAQGTRLPREEN
jgi:hypothetical protein